MAKQKTSQAAAPTIEEPLKNEGFENNGEGTVKSDLASDGDQGFVVADPVSGTIDTKSAESSDPGTESSDPGKESPDPGKESPYLGKESPDLGTESPAKDPAPAVSKIASLQKRQDRVYHSILAQLNSIGK